MLTNIRKLKSEANVALWYGMKWTGYGKMFLKLFPNERMGCLHRVVQDAPVVDPLFSHQEQSHLAIAKSDMYSLLFIF